MKIKSIFICSISYENVFYKKLNNFYSRLKFNFCYSSRKHSGYILIAFENKKIEKRVHELRSS